MPIIEDRAIVSVFIATSIDGYIAKKDGNIDWLYNIPETGEDYGFNKFFSSEDVLIMGRKTYEKVLTFEKWPYEGKRVIVLSNTLQHNVMQYNTELYQGSIKLLTKKLYSEGIKHIYIDGGFTIREFIKAKIVDHIIISIIPVILGDGIALFDKPLPETWYQLELVKQYQSGLVMLNYKLNQTAE